MIDNRTDGSRVSKDGGGSREEHWDFTHSSSSGVVLSDIESALSE